MGGNKLLTPPLPPRLGTRSTTLWPISQYCFNMSSDNHVLSCGFTVEISSLCGPLLLQIQLAQHNTHPTRPHNERGQPIVYPRAPPGTWGSDTKTARWLCGESVVGWWVRRRMRRSRRRPPLGYAYQDFFRLIFNVFYGEILKH